MSNHANLSRPSNISANMSIKEDEVRKFLMGRYISSNEAVWRILNFQIHERYPTVVHLSVHLENGQRVYFNQENIHQQILGPPEQL